MKNAVIIGATLWLTACAKPSDKISASYVSPLEYREYSCAQLSAEVARTNTRAAEVAGVQDEAASDDAALMGIGIVLFWPSLFFLEGDTGREAELARLRGAISAIETEAIRKDCREVVGELARQRELAREAAVEDN